MTAAALEDAFRRAMRLTAAGVAVVATDGPAGRAGLTVSSLCSLTIEPPALIFCVNRKSRALDQIMRNGVFCANVLASPQARVADVFAGLVPEMADRRFEEGAWSAAPSGSPVLDDALCSFDCNLAPTFEFGTHQIIVGQVKVVWASATEPLIYMNRQYRNTVAN